MDYENKTEFSKIGSPEKLKQFLEDKGKRHTPYFHYAKMAVLQGMLESRHLFLTRADCLNDALECTAAPALKLRTYIASFSFHSAENVAMWSMYGVPYEEAIRLTIPRRAITKILKDFAKSPKVYSVEDHEELTCAINANLKMIDIVYAYPASLEHDKEFLLHRQGDFVANAKSAPQMAPYVKNAIWASETETRMVLEFDKVLPGDIKKIAIDFDYAVENLEVTGGPCVSKKDLDRRFPDLAKNGKTHESVVYNKTYFRVCSGKWCSKRTKFCSAHNK